MTARVFNFCSPIANQRGVDFVSQGGCHNTTGSPS